MVLRPCLYTTTAIPAIIIIIIIITLSGTYYIIGRFYYIIGHVLQYRALITLSVGTDAITVVAVLTILGMLTTWSLCRRQ